LIASSAINVELFVLFAVFKIAFFIYA